MVYGFFFYCLLDYGGDIIKEDKGFVFGRWNRGDDVWMGNRLSIFDERGKCSVVRWFFWDSKDGENMREVGGFVVG